MRWVAENAHPFDIVNDNGFQCLMKTGRPDYYIPNPNTVSCNVWTAFVQVWQRLAEKLQVCSATSTSLDTPAKRHT